METLRTAVRQGVRSMKLRWNLLAWRKAENIVSQWEKKGCHLSKSEREAAIRDVKDLIETLEWEELKAIATVYSTDSMFKTLAVLTAHSAYRKRTMMDMLMKLSASYCGKYIFVRV